MSGDVIIEVQGGVGRLQLNRPKALHALNLSMCRAMLDALAAWINDPAVGLVMIDHAEGRGFCAGGDIRMLAESGAADGKEAAAFFHTEYQLNHLLFTYPKPVIAFMDGITMGGGVGISLPCRYRVATERTRLAMPESGIGLFPDVGGGWYLSRLPGRIGAWLALTGASLNGADCVALRVATHYIPSGKVEEAKAALLSSGREPQDSLAAWTVEASPPAIQAQQADINRLFASDRYEDILAALRSDGGEWATAQLAALAKKSNLTCKIALRQLIEAARHSDFADEMRMEYRIATRICRSADFIEGVRALLIDKDLDPKWTPAEPEGVTESMVEEYFAPMPPGEEWQPLRIKR
ncbi:Enoyl-CoA hydratase/isomerase [Sphingomonas paucimobilis]|nr:Enoyl-CoA hydratase/isomerase [Sphingomonas paucimobilis]